MGLKCPSCNISFHPQFSHQFLAYKKGKSDRVYVYYQLCPECDEPIIGYKQHSDFDYPTGKVDDVILLIKPK